MTAEYHFRPVLRKMTSNLCLPKNDWMSMLMYADKFITNFKELNITISPNYCYNCPLNLTDMTKLCMVADNLQC